MKSWEVLGSPRRSRNLLAEVAGRSRSLGSCRHSNIYIYIYIGALRQEAPQKSRFIDVSIYESLSRSLYIRGPRSQARHTPRYDRNGKTAGVRKQELASQPASQLVCLLNQLSKSKSKSKSNRKRSKIYDRILIGGPRKSIINPNTRVGNPSKILGQSWYHSKSW